MAMKARGRTRQKDPPKQLASKRASAFEVGRWRKAWDHPASRLYLGWIDPFPMPPGTPCKPCLGGTRFWCEAETPHRDWRCVACHPAPAGLAVRIYEIDVQAEEAERARIEAAQAPPPARPKEPVTTQDNWWE